MNINQVVLKEFRASLALFPRQNPNEIAREARTLLEKYLATCNDETWNPGQSIPE
jgi:hypothetical protein